MSPARCVLVLAVVLSAAPAIDAQAPPGRAGNRDPHLRIDSPRDGAEVAPGETLEVRVSSPDRTRFVGITLIMEDPFDIDQAGEATSLPARLAVKIPEDIAPGSYSVSVLAARAKGELVVATIDIDIESAGDAARAHAAGPAVPVPAGLPRTQRTDEGRHRSARRFWKRLRRRDQVVEAHLRVVGHRCCHRERVRHNHCRWGRACDCNRVVRAARQGDQSHNPRRSATSSSVGRTVGPLRTIDRCSAADDSTRCARDQAPARARY